MAMRYRGGFVATTIRGVELLAFAVLLGGGLAAYQSQTVAAGAPRSIVIAALGLFAVAIFARVMLALRPMPLAAMPDLRCPTCGYSLAGLVRAGKCPECGVAYHGESVGGHRLEFDAGAAGRALLSCLGVVFGVGVPIAAIVVRLVVDGDNVSDTARHASNIGAAVFVPHALCSAVVGKHLGARRFQGFWIGGVAAGALAAATAIIVGGVDIGFCRLGDIPVPEACAALGIVVGSLGGLALLACGTRGG